MWSPRSACCASTSASTGSPSSSAGPWAPSRRTSGPCAFPTECCARRRSPGRPRTLNEQLWSDPGWNGGEYSSHTEVVDGLTRHAHLWGTMGFSTEFWKQQKWAALGFDSMQAFLTDFLEPYFTAMDPNDLLTMAWKWQRGDVSRHTDGDLAAALGRITAKTFVMPISEDMFFPVRDCAAEQALIPGSELRVIDDVHGHLGLFAVDPGFIPQVDAALSDLLAGPVDGSRAA